MCPSFNMNCIQPTNHDDNVATCETWMHSYYPSSLKIDKVNMSNYKW